MPRNRKFYNLYSILDDGSRPKDFEEFVQCTPINHWLNKIEPERRKKELLEYNAPKRLQELNDQIASLENEFRKEIDKILKADPDFGKPIYTPEEEQEIIQKWAEGLRKPAG